MGIFCDFYKDELIFLTGVTGFVGKVYLERVLRETKYSKVVCLLREKDGKSVEDRFRDEIILSPIFDELRKFHSNFAQWITSRVSVVSGDFTIPNLGLSTEVESSLLCTVTQVVSLTANCDFLAKPREAFEYAVVSPLNILAFARRCVNLRYMSHVSSAYANANLGSDSIIEEKLYPIPCDPEELLAAALSSSDSPSDKALLASTMKGYPSVVNLARSVGEHLLVRNKGKVPLIILRPSIIGAAWRAPMPGWIDTLSPLAALFLLAGSGALFKLRGRQVNIGDFIPVDLLANCLLVAPAAYCHRWGVKRDSAALLEKAFAHRATVADCTPEEAIQRDIELSNFQIAMQKHRVINQPSLLGRLFGKAEQTTTDVLGTVTSPGVIIHVSSANLHPCPWGLSRRAIVTYFTSQPLSLSDLGKQTNPSFEMADRSKMTHLLAHSVVQGFKMTILSVMASIIPSASLARLASRFQKVVETHDQIASRFEPYMNNNWNFSTRNLASLHKVIVTGYQMFPPKPENPKASLWLDPRVVDWEEWLLLFAYGLQKWILKESPLFAPVSGHFVASDDQKHTTPSLFVSTKALTSSSHSSSKEVDDEQQVDNVSTSRSNDLVPRDVSPFFKTDLLQRAKSIFLDAHLPDIQFALTTSPTDFPTPTSDYVIDSVLKNNKVIAVIDKIAKKSLGDKLYTERQLKKAYASVEKRARKNLVAMAAGYSKKHIMAFAWGLHKIFKTIFERVIIDQQSVLDALNLRREDGPVLLLPTHRSYVDFLVLSYLCFAFDQRLPFIAAGDDFSKMGGGISSLLRNSGAFFMQRSMKGSSDNALLYSVCFKSYFQEVITQQGFVEFFVEGTRSRAGLMLSPRMGLLSWAIEPLIEGRVRDIRCVPVSVCYDRVLESQTFPREMLGETKVGESFLRVLRGVKVLFESLGDLHIRFGNIISVRGILDEHALKAGIKLPPLLARSDVQNSIHARRDDPPPAPANPETTTLMQTLPKDVIRSTVEDLGGRIIDTLSMNLVILPNSLVATVLLANRRGLPQNEVVRSLSTLKRFLDSQHARFGGAEVAGCGPQWQNKEDEMLSVSAALKAAREKHLSQLLVPTGKLKIGMSEGERLIIPKPDFDSMLLLAYYRNTMLHAVLNEAFVCTALASFSKKSNASTNNPIAVPADALMEELSFLFAIVGPEFEFPRKPKIADRDSYKALNDALSSGIVQVLSGEAAERARADWISRGRRSHQLTARFRLTAAEQAMKALGLKDESEAKNTFIQFTKESVFDVVPILISSLLPFIDAYWVTAQSCLPLLIPSANPRRMTAKSLARVAQWKAEEAVAEGLIEHVESRSLSTITFALATFEALGIIVPTSRNAANKNSNPSNLKKKSKGDAISPVLTSPENSVVLNDAEKLRVTTRVALPVDILQLNSRKSTTLAQIADRDSEIVMQMTDAFADREIIDDLVLHLGMFRKVTRTGNMNLASGSGSIVGQIKL